MNARALVCSSRVRRLSVVRRRLPQVKKHQRRKFLLLGRAAVRTRIRLYQSARLRQRTRKVSRARKRGALPPVHLRNGYR